MKSIQKFIVLLIVLFLGNTAIAQPIPNPSDYDITNGQVSEQVLRNYLKRNVSMSVAAFLRDDHMGNTNVFTDRPAYDCLLDFIRTTHPKMINEAGSIGWDADLWAYNWPGSGGTVDLFEQHRLFAEDVHNNNPEDYQIILQATLNEVVGVDLGPNIHIPIPSWVKSELGAEYENIGNFFDASQMQFSPVDANRYVDITQKMTIAWFYWAGRQFIDLGYEALRIGQILRIGANDAATGYSSTHFLLEKLRDYAKTSGTSRRGFVIIECQSNGLYYTGPGHVPQQLLFDVHSWPLQAIETGANGFGTTANGYLSRGNGLVPGTDLEATIQNCEPNGNNIYGNSKGGLNPLGWSTASNPYFVEFDNIGGYIQGVTSPGYHMQCHFPWGMDESFWFYQQSPEYQKHWLIYAWHRVRCLDQTGYFSPAVLKAVPSPQGVWPHFMFGYSQSPMCARTDGLDLTQTIKNIWDANDATLPGNVNGVDMGPYNKWTNEFLSVVQLQNNTPSQLELPVGKLYFGDFNGDTYIDILETANPALGQNWGGWKLFLMTNGSYNMSMPNNFGSFPGWGEKIYVGDFDGDGMDDFITLADPSTGTTWFGTKLFISSGNNFQHVSNRNFPNFGERINIGDFDGDGKDDIMATADINQGINWAGYYIFTSTGTTFNQAAHDIWPSWGERFFIGDFNGDTKDDFLVTSELSGAIPNPWTGYKVYHSDLDINNSMIFTHKATGNWPSWGENIVIGDWNLDGHSDMTAISSPIAPVWSGSKTYMCNEAGDHFIYAFDYSSIGHNPSAPPLSNIGKTYFSFKRPNVFNLIEFVNQSSTASLNIYNTLHCNTSIWHSAKPAKSTDSTNTKATVSVATTHADTSPEVYPNPSQNGIFYIMGIKPQYSKIANISVVNMVGATLIERSYNTDNTIDLSSYPNGVYILSLEIGNTITRHRLVVNK